MAHRNASNMFASASEVLRRRTAILAATSLLGCAAGASEPEEPAAAPARTYHTAPPGTLPPDTRPPPPEEPLPELQALAMAVGDIPEVGRADHAHVARALYALADALMLVGPTRTDLLDEMRSFAEQLTASPNTATHHADLVRRSFEHAVVIFARGAARDPWRRPEYVDAVSAFGDMVQALDPTRPLLTQHAEVIALFQSAVDLVELAAGIAVRE